MAAKAAPMRAAARKAQNLSSCEQWFTALQKVIQASRVTFRLKHAWERALLSSNRSERLNAVQAYIEDKLQWGELTPAATARAFAISVRQLHLLFEPTGTTFSRYVLSRRLERARRVLLRDPTRKILDVALDCGIESSTVFYRAFREAFGMNPTDYRRSLHNAASSQWAMTGAGASAPQPI